MGELIRGALIGAVFGVALLAAMLSVGCQANHEGKGNWGLGYESQFKLYLWEDIEEPVENELSGPGESETEDDAANGNTSTDS